ncbi:MAB_1171c family putative transporter [Streptomyces afghaniensis]|uniref:MAB_1171c family putative transporter n=1 Tax=Streptomyces afghaniensis TaxID=66865 RepID=UPI00278260FF|nr:MAB_1171c family putative transporter [Streptomyces afghaniensis]MDQ1018906.1 putative integral membrane protein [Streptomyces afghaniensis]
MASGPSNLIYHISGSILWLVCAVKIPTLVRRRDDALLRAACRLLFAGGCIMFLAAPNIVLALNRLTGVTNFSAPAVYAALTAYSAAALLLIINWRPAPAEQIRRISRWVVIAYGFTVLIIFLLFWAGNAPVQQLTLFDTYYANTPYIREMIVVYLVAHGVAATASIILCWRWSKQIRGYLRTGLHLLVCAYVLHLCYDVCRLVGVAARWTGHNLDFLIDQVTPRFAALSAVLGAVGFTLPLVGPRVSETTRVMRQLRQLNPLWRTLQHVPTPGAVRTSLPWWRTPPALLLTSRKTALYDAILALSPYCDPTIRDAAYQTALRSGASEPTAEATADAAMILVACERQRTDPEAQTTTQLTTLRSPDLIPLSQALTLPVVQDLHEHHRAPAESGPS